MNIETRVVSSKVRLIIAFAALVMGLSSINAATVAYWRFETGPANTDRYVRVEYCIVLLLFSLNSFLICLFFSLFCFVFLFCFLFVLPYFCSFLLFLI